MKLESETGGLHTSTLKERPIHSIPTTKKSPSSPMIETVLGAMSPNAPRLIAVAPGRLNIFGGLSEYTGSLVLSATTEAHVVVGIQPRTDQLYSIRLASAHDRNGTEAITLDHAKLFDKGNTPLSAEQVLGQIPGQDTNYLLGVFAALVEGVREALIATPATGLDFVVGTTLPADSDSGRLSAITAAVLTGLTSLQGVQPDIEKSTRIGRRVSETWFNRAANSAEVLASLVGRSQTLMEFRGDSGEISGDISLANGFRLMGVDCGVVHEGASRKYRLARTATLMGCELIRRIIQHENNRSISWKGFLSCITATDFVDLFRDRIPTKLRGREYVERFGEIDDPFVILEPDQFYKIRSRTEHHIYEHFRACQFKEWLAKANHDNHDDGLIEAGELMHASHWSYGQRCGLGCVETDLLVSLFRRLGPEHDIFGAKVTGYGCGGVVAVLLKETERSAQAIRQVLADYQTHCQRQPTVIPLGRPGAIHAGVQHFN